MRERKREKSIFLQSWVQYMDKACFLKAFIHLSLVVGINKIHVIFILLLHVCQFGPLIKTARVRITHLL